MLKQHACIEIHHLFSTPPLINIPDLSPSPPCLHTLSCVLLQRSVRSKFWLPTGSSSSSSYPLASILSVSLLFYDVLFFGFGTPPGVTPSTQEQYGAEPGLPHALAFALVLQVHFLLLLRHSHIFSFWFFGSTWLCSGSLASDHSWWCPEDQMGCQGIEPRMAAFKQTTYPL